MTLSCGLFRFIKTCRKNLIVQKKYGSTNNIMTHMIHLSAKLGKNIYLAKDVDVRKDAKIGDNSYCSPRTILFNGTEIGKFCSIGYNVQIGLPEHPVNFMSTSPVVYRNKQIKQFCPWPEDDYKSPVTIGNDVWIGSNAIILQGVKVGNGAIIAAGAVVSKDVKDFTIVGGIPAKQIGIRFENDMIEKISNRQWWNLEIKDIEIFVEELYGGKNENSSVSSN